MILRDYQCKAVEATRDSWSRCNSTLLELATGLGKTIIATTLGNECERDGGRTMFVAPFIPLIGQAAKNFKEVTGIVPDIEQAGNTSNEAVWGKNPFIVASKQSLCRERRDGTRRYEKFKDISRLVLDEAHLFATQPGAEMVSYFIDHGAKVLGVTATARRYDNRAMGQLFEECPYQFGIVEAMPEGWLVPPKVTCAQLQTLDLSGVETKSTVNGKDFDAAQLNEKLEDLKTVYEIADVTARECGSSKTVVYCSSVNEAKLIGERLQDHYGIAAGWICADEQRCTRQRRQDVLKSFTEDDGGIQVVANVGCLTTGWDFPGLEHIVMARPTKSLPLYQQIFGRGTRPLKGVVDFSDSTAELRCAAIANSRKPFFRVTDLVDCSMEHKIITSADVLGGKYTLQEVARAKADIMAASGPQDLGTALAEAKRKIREEAEEKERRRRAQVTARVQYKKVEVDPFDRYSANSGTSSKRVKGARMPFGKHKGMLVSDVPTGYLKWLAGESKAGWLGSAIKAELAARMGRSTGLPITHQLDDVNRQLLEAMA